MAAWGVLLLGFLWTYWETMVHIVRVWWIDARLWPWLLRADFRRLPALAASRDGRSLAQPGHMVGDPVLRGLCARSLVQPVPELRARHRFAVAIPGWLTLVLGGWRALRWAWPSILFLIFMVPLPDFVAAALGGKLQRRGHHHERLCPANARHPGHRAGRRLRTSFSFPSRRTSWKLPGLAAGCG